VTVRVGAAAVLLSIVAGAEPGVAQGLRGSATGTARYYDLRPIVRDTAPRAEVTQNPDGSFTWNGIPVTCTDVTGCVYSRSGERSSIVALTQDVGFTAWGLGLRGLSVTALLRARADVGGDITWPRSDDAFDAILAYAELNRGPLRARLGRQRATSGLGFTGFDGASALYEPYAWLELEAYGGRSLARGLNEPRAEALRPIEDFVLDREVYLVGAATRVRPWDGTAVGVRYQREIWASRSGLVSERAAADFTTSRLAPVTIDAALDYDFAFGRIGKAHATARAPLGRGVVLETTARRYLPYFELWTIWGFFRPVAYHEAEARATWRATSEVTAWITAGWRRYDEANATVILRPLERDGVRASLGGLWHAAPNLLVDASYRIEHGFGAFLSSGDASVRWEATPQLAFSLDATAFQQIEQFRVGEGMVWGGGPGFDVEITPTIGVVGGASVYHQSFDNRPAFADWNQVRAWTALRVGFGRDPGQRRAGVAP
jgi:hypothetical protein